MSEFLILIYAEEGAWDALTPDEQALAYSHYEAFDERNASVIRGGGELLPTGTATSVRSDGAGGFLVTDGAFVETKEALGGYFVIEVDTLDEALAVAKQLPLHVGGVEVRPLSESDS